MMGAGEKVASSVQFRDYVLIIGEWGTIVKCAFDEVSGQHFFTNIGEIRRA